MRTTALVLEHQPLVLMRERLLGMITDTVSFDRRLPDGDSEIEALAAVLERQTGTRVLVAGARSAKWGEVEMRRTDAGIELRMPRMRGKATFVDLIGATPAEDSSTVLLSFGRLHQ